MKSILFLIMISSIMSNYVPNYERSTRRRHGYGYVNNNVSDSWVKNEKLNGHANAGSNGNGSSTAISGRKGSHAQAEGTHGSKSWTKHQNEKNSARDKWSTYVDSKGKRNQVRDTWVDSQINDNQADAVSEGKGNTKAISDDDTSAAFGEGSKGSQVDSIYRNNRKSKRDKFQNYFDGLKNIQVRDQFAYKGRIKTRGKGEGIGHGRAITQSNHRGTGVQDRGNKGSRGITDHKGDPVVWLMLGVNLRT